MKLFAIFAAIAAGVSSLRTERDEEHELSGLVLSLCCLRKQGEKCGVLFKTSCCLKGRCAAGLAGSEICPDQYQLKC